MQSAAGAAKLQRTLVAVVVAGAVVIAAIGFAGSYAAVRELAERKGFGAFAPFFPIGVDAGIVVLLALDLLLTWIRIPFPLLRQTAWLLTAATIAFNGAAAWPDPLGVGMHAVIPVLFVVTVEAARHAAGRVAALTADKHMEGVRLSRWLLAFPSTFLLWRRMKLWELRHYDEVIRMEQDRLIYETRLRARYGRSWRRKAPAEALMPLKLTRYGIPLARTVPSEKLRADAPAMLGEDFSAEHSPPDNLPPRGPRSAEEFPPQPGAAAGSRLRRRLLPAPDAGRAVAAGEGRTSRPVVEARVAGEEAASGATSTGSGDRLPGGPGREAEPGTPNSTAVRARTPGESRDSRHGDTTAPAQGRQRAAVPPQEQPESVVSRAQEPRAADQLLQPAGERGPTIVDRYYEAWAELTDKLGAEPDVQDLSDYLWVRGMSGRGGGRISPSTLRRYRMGWRIYRVWAQYLEDHGGAEPSLGELEELCAEHAIRSKGGRGERLAQPDLEGHLPDFRRRYAALTGR
ncbi:DUF2637 domain-containing protein [Streptomyces sp. AA1529]|uniref:DUF2637 domain-containing protein n=2 Tax=unclassified Streptomyces TaxID=2593676 RepID=UPI003D71BE70